MEFNFDALRNEIEAAARAAFIELLNRDSEHEIYSFALYSDEGAMTVCPAANSTAWLNRQIEEDPSQTDYYTYVPAEWKYEGTGADNAFEGICTKLRNHLDTLDGDKAFNNFRNELFECCVSVLEKLKKEGFFNQTAGRDILVIFDATEYEFKKKFLQSMIKRLNSQAMADKYLEWVTTWCR